MIVQLVDSETGQKYEWTKVWLEYNVTLVKMTRKWDNSVTLAKKTKKFHNSVALVKKTSKCDKSVTLERATFKYIYKLIYYKVTLLSHLLG